MGKEDLTLGEYLDHLRQERKKLDALISHIESTIGGPLVVVPTAAAGHARAGEGVYANMTIIDAAMTFLRTAGRPQKTEAIVSALRAGGIKSSADNPYRTIYNTLSQKIGKGITKVGKSKWGLSEWVRTSEAALGV